jgi:hypothetical protein
MVVRYSTHMSTPIGPILLAAILMEHIGIAVDPLHPVVEVPLICEHDCDDGTFGEYHSRRGFNKVRMMGGDFTEKPPEETAAFLQQWLYFGMLSEVLGVPIPVNDFVAENAAGRPIIVTNKLPAYITIWRIEVQHLSPDIRRSRLAAVDVCMDQVAWICRMENQPFAPPLSPEIFLSIKVLGVSLQAAKLEIFDLYGNNNSPDFNVYHFIPRMIVCCRADGVRATSRDSK